MKYLKAKKVSLSALGLLVLSGFLGINVKSYAAELPPSSRSGFLQNDVKKACALIAPMIGMVTGMAQATPVLQSKTMRDDFNHVKRFWAYSWSWGDAERVIDPAKDLTDEGFVKMYGKKALEQAVAYETTEAGKKFFARRGLLIGTAVASGLYAICSSIDDLANRAGITDSRFKNRAASVEAAHDLPFGQQSGPRAKNP